MVSIEMVQKYFTKRNYCFAGERESDINRDWVKENKKRFSDSERERGRPDSDIRKQG